MENLENVVEVSNVCSVATVVLCLICMVVYIIRYDTYGKNILCLHENCLLTLESLRYTVICHYRPLSNCRLFDQIQTYDLNVKKVENSLSKSPCFTSIFLYAIYKSAEYLTALQTLVVPGFILSYENM